MDDISDRSLSLTRILDAPRELVWQVWTDPQHVVNWWGPDGFTNTNQSMDVSPGGFWRFVMHGPDGTDYKNLIQFIKLQLAGNILFWGTLIGSFILHDVVGWSEFAALVVASVTSHALFFIADKEWVFNEGKDGRKSSDEIARFIIFMGLNFFINLGIVTSVDMFLDAHSIPFEPLTKLGESIDVNLYIAQFVSGLFFTFWTFIGLKYWVFRKTGKAQVASAKRKSSK